MDGGPPTARTLTFLTPDGHRGSCFVILLSAFKISPQANKPTSSSPYMPLIAPGDLIVDSWINFRRNLATYVEVVIWFALLGVVRWAIASFSRAFVGDVSFRYLLTLLMNLPVLFIYGILTIALTDLVGAHLDKRKMDVRTALNNGIHKIFSAIWVSIITGAGIALGFIFFVIPAFILTIRWRFAQDFLILDGIKGVSAVKASSKIVSGRWWITLGRVLAPAIFFYAGAAFVTSIAYLLFGAMLGDPGLFFGQYSAGQVLPKTHEIITAIVPQITSGFALPLYIGAELLLWADLKKTA